MITLLLADADSYRRAWLTPKLEQAGFILCNWADCAEKILSHVITYKPKIVLVAPSLGDVTGAKATHMIMEKHPVPVVLMCRSMCGTVSMNPEENACGATALIEMPEPPDSPNHKRQVEALITALKLMHEIPVIRRTSQQLKKPLSNRSRTSSEDWFVKGAPPPPTPAIDALIKRTKRPSRLGLPKIIGIASSTGGPPVVERIIRNLPADYPVPIMLVQHLSKGFSQALVSWLNEHTALNVKEISHGDKALPGTVHVASGQHHVRLEPGLHFSLMSRSLYNGHCPSANVMFESLAKVCGEQSVGIILTGMGDDGSNGLLMLKETGAMTYAQDEASCVISSMPKEAVKKGAVCARLTPEEIADALLELASEKKNK